MKIKSLLLAMIACAGMFTACSNDLDEVASDNGQNTEKNAFASFSFLMPAGTGTRAAGGEQGDGSQQGTLEENQITNVYILLFKGENLAQVETLGRADFTPTDLGSYISYTTKNEIAVDADTYKVYVVVNPTKTFQAGYGKSQVGTKTLTQFLVDVEQVAVSTGEYCTDNNFMMTNADPAVDTTVASDNTTGKAKSITVNVERIAAKVTFTPKEAGDLAANTYEIKNSSTQAVVGKVTLDAFKVINTRNSAFNLRRVSNGENTSDITIGGKETPIAGLATNYVVENQWNIKNAWSESSFTTNYSRKYNTYVAFRYLNTDKGQTLAYCLENTMPKGNQIEGYTTTVILRGKATFNAGVVIGATEGEAYTGTFLKYAGKYYTTIEEICKETRWNVEEMKALTANELYDDYSVETFTNGFCYYKVFLRHSDNGKTDESGIMEFAIVRNNVYTLKVNSIKFLGSCSSGTTGGTEETEEPDNKDPENPNPEMPGNKVTDPSEPTDPIIPVDPEDPDEKGDQTYLDVTIKVLDWTVRDNGVDL